MNHLVRIAFMLSSFILNPIMSTPFSFTEIQQIPDVTLQQPSFFTTSDDCRLAYYSFIPPLPKAIVVFYHGAGLYGNRIHQWIGKQLQQKHAIGTFIIDIRGHGNSGGARGDAPTIQTVWQDISTIIERIQAQYPEIPLYLAGHSSGAGLLLNYAAWPAHKKVNGLILLAPYLGPLSGTLKEYDDPELQFAKQIRTWVYTIAGITGGRLCGHIPAIYFNYPQSILNDPKIVKYYTYTMSAATTPYQTKSIFQAIHLPTAMLIAEKDEQFIADAIAHYADDMPISVYRYVEIIKDAKHLTLLLQAPQLIAQMIEKLHENSKKRTK